MLSTMINDIEAEVSNAKTEEQKEALIKALRELSKVIYKRENELTKEIDHINLVRMSKELEQKQKGQDSA
jgi:hypothetical protein